MVCITYYNNFEATAACGIKMLPTPCLNCSNLRNVLAIVLSSTVLTLISY